MKSTGIVRKVDGLGRFVIPKELRRLLEWDEKERLEVYREGDTILIRKYVPNSGGCCFCGQDQPGGITWAGHRVCPACIGQMQKLCGL